MFTEHEALLASLLQLLSRRLRHKCQQDLLELLDNVSHIRDPKLRRRSFLRRLAGEKPVIALEMLYCLGRLSRMRHPGAQALMLDLLDEEKVKEEIPGPLLEEIWRLGRLRGYQDTLALFFYTSDQDSRFEEKPRLPPETRDIPLGRRKAMARLDNIYALEHLLKDNDVSVIRNLLSNPRITEREVIRLVARRPNTATILSAVATDHRWICRYAVKKALIYNPHTPINIALPLLRYLVIQDLRDLCRLSSVNDLLKQAAVRLLQRREDGFEAGTDSSRPVGNE